MGTPVAITTLWLRKHGELIELLVEIDGKWHQAIREDDKGDFNYVLECSAILERRMTDNKNPPSYWMHETSGVLRPAIEAYLNNVEMTPGQIAAMRAYLRQWAAGDWAPGEYLEELRTSVNGITSRADIESWIYAAVENLMDPL